MAMIAEVAMETGVNRYNSLNYQMGISCFIRRAMSEGVKTSNGDGKVKTVM